MPLSGRQRLRIRHRRHARPSGGRRGARHRRRARGARRVTAAGRPYALFTNGSHLAPAAFARELRAAGLPVEDEQVLTPLCSAQTYLERFRGEARVLPFVTEPARAYLQERRRPSRRRPQRRASRRGARRPHRRDRLRRAGACRPRGHRGCAPARRQLRPGLRGRKRADPEPRRDGHRRHREGEQHTADRRRQALARSSSRDGAAARRAGDRRSQSSATTSASRWRSAVSAARRRSSSAAASVALSICPSFRRRSGRTLRSTPWRRCSRGSSGPDRGAGWAGGRRRRRARRPGAR